MKGVRMLHLVKRTRPWILMIVTIWACQNSSISTAQNTSSKNLWTNAADRSSGSGTSIDIAALNQVFTRVADLASPSVVLIQTSTRVGNLRRFGGGGDDLFRFFFGNPFEGAPGSRPEPRASALGSGFVINTDGLIITNAHVVRNNRRNVDEIKVKFSGDDPQSPGHDAEIVGADDETEVAVIRLKNKVPNLKPIPLGDSDKMKVGEWVVAIGNPHGHAHTVTKGIVSALGRNIADELRADFIQTDASINPGNSGGPLIDLYGNVIGINTAIDPRAQGIGFAIPINTAKSIVSQLVEKGEVIRGYVGIYLDDLNPKILKHFKLPEFTRGAFIQDVIAGGPAAKAGIQSYDIITDFDGKKITSARDLRNAIGQVTVGKTAAYSALRNGKTVTGKITIENHPDRMGQPQVARGQDAKGKPSQVEDKIGLRLSPLTPQIRQQLRLPRDISGVVVEDVMGGIAYEANLQPGDVILEVNRKPVSSVSEAEKLLSSNESSVMLKVMRGNQIATIFIDK